MRNICVVVSTWIAAMVLAPGISHAEVLTQAFTIQVPFNTTVGAATSVASSTLSQFDPTTGTLTSVNTTFSGIGSWLNPAMGQMLELSLVVHERAVVLAGQREFFVPGAINFNFTGNDSYLPELTSFVGPGLTQVDLRFSGSGGTLTTPPNIGTISYVFTPTVAIPEPEAVWLTGLGLVMMGLLRGRRGTSIRDCI